MDNLPNSITGGQCFGQDDGRPAALAIVRGGAPASAQVDLSEDELVFLLGHLGSDKGSLSTRPGGAFTALKAMALRERLEAALGDLQ